MTNNFKTPEPLRFLPEPFEWIYIPKGNVILSGIAVEGKFLEEYIEEVPAFSIAKYPITNAQYAVYREETGYIPFTTEQNWAIDLNAAEPNHPICSLRWHEAMWFARWISEKASYLITLPTHSQWQRAAQGDDDRRYPWGNEWNSSYCNTADSRNPGTTPVTHYPQGASPFGVMDMVGNVSEWCLTSYPEYLNSLDIPILDVNTLQNIQRVFKGGHAGTSTYSADVRKYGATLIWFPYSTGIRLVTTATTE
jgi:toxoflavin biosynthesis protein ToxD